MNDTINVNDELDQRGAGTEFGLSRRFAPADKSPLNLVFVAGRLLNSKLVGEVRTTKIIGDTEYKISLNGSYNLGQEGLLFLTIIKMLNDQSMKDLLERNVNDIEPEKLSLRLSFDELDKLDFIAKSANRKRFNEKELKDSVEITLSNSLTTTEAANEIYKMKRVNDSLYSAFAIKSSSLRMTVAIQKEGQKPITGIYPFFNSIIVNHEEGILELELSEKLSNLCREVDSNRYPSISLLSNTKCTWTKELYMFLLSNQKNKELFFYQSEFAEHTNTKKTDFNFRKDITAALKSLEEQNVLTITRKYSIKKNGNTQYWFKLK